MTYSLSKQSTNIQWVFVPDLHDRQQEGSCIHSPQIESSTPSQLLLQVDALAANSQSVPSLNLKLAVLMLEDTTIEAGSI